MIKKILKLNMALIISSFLIIGCKNENAPAPSLQESIKVGTITGPETDIMDVAKQVAQEKFNLEIEIVEFQDYATPNTALVDGSIDANAYQTVQYLDSYLAAHNANLVSVGKTFVYPMGLYSKKITNLAQLPHGATVAIPNDPSNEQRGLLLLIKAGLIKVDNTSDPISTLNITENPLQLKIITLEAAQLARSLEDADLVAINTNYAIEADLYPTKDALLREGEDSPYVNIIVTRKELENDPRILHLVAAYHSVEVIAKAEQLFQGQAIPGWSPN